eukprot:34401-Prymnesium_polylepis.2
MLSLSYADVHTPPYMFPPEYGKRHCLLPAGGEPGAVESIKELNSTTSTPERRRSGLPSSTCSVSATPSRNALLPLCMKKRVKKAISNAKKQVKFDIGDDAKKRKLEESDSDNSDSDSESSEEEELLGPRKPSAKMPKNTNVPRPVVHKLAVATSSSMELAAPPLSSRKLGGGTSGAAMPKERHAKDTEGSCCMDQTFVDDLGIFVSDGVPFEPPEDLNVLMQTFTEAKQLARSSFHTGSAQVYASYSPDADWRGVHHGDGTCLINIALATTKEDMIGVICHEVSHEYVGPHDYRFVQYIQWHCTETTARPLVRAFGAQCARVRAMRDGPEPVRFVRSSTAAVLGSLEPLGHVCTQVLPVVRDRRSPSERVHRSVAQVWTAFACLWRKGTRRA